MPNARNRKAPQTPGEAPKAEQMPPQEPAPVADPVAEQTAPEESAAPDAADGDQQVTVSVAELEAMITSRVDQAAAQAVHAFRREQQAGKKKEPDLPNAADIDPDEIENSVLTKTGWVVPRVSKTDKLRMENEAKKIKG